MRNDFENIDDLLDYQIELLSKVDKLSYEEFDYFLKGIIVFAIGHKDDYDIVDQSFLLFRKWTGLLYGYTSRVYNLDILEEYDRNTNDIISLASQLSLKKNPNFKSIHKLINDYEDNNSISIQAGQLIEMELSSEVLTNCALYFLSEHNDFTTIGKVLQYKPPKGKVLSRTLQSAAKHYDSDAPILKVASLRLGQMGFADYEYEVGEAFRIFNQKTSKSAKKANN